MLSRQEEEEATLKESQDERWDGDQWKIFGVRCVIGSDSGFEWYVRESVCVSERDICCDVLWEIGRIRVCGEKDGIVVGWMGVFIESQ